MKSFDWIMFLLLNHFFSSSEKSIEIDKVSEREEQIIKKISQEFNNIISIVLPSILSDEINNIEEIKRYVFLTEVSKIALIDSSSMISRINTELERIKTEYDDSYDAYKNKLDEMWIQYLEEKQNLPFSDCFHILCGLRVFTIRWRMSKHIESSALCNEEWGR